MEHLEDKKVMVVGGSRGLGAAISRAAAAGGAKVLTIGRSEADLERLAKTGNGLGTLALDMTYDDAPARAFDRMVPDLLVQCGGAAPEMAPISKQTWDTFTRNWDVDVKSTFQFGQAALRAPLPSGSSFVTISSGAGIGGSPLSGGYAGAKRTQWFLSNYFGAESDNRGLGIRFVTILPRQQFKETELGQSASSGYAQALGISQEEFLGRFKNALNPDSFADIVLKIVYGRDHADGKAYAVNGEGIEKLG